VERLQHRCACKEDPSRDISSQKSPFQQEQAQNNAAWPTIDLLLL